MAYTEILLPQTYINDAGGFDFQIDNWWQPGAPQWANLHPDIAVAAMRENSTSIPPPAFPPVGTPPDATRMYGRYLNFGIDHGNGRFEMTNPVIVNGLVQSVAVYLLYIKPTGPDMDVDIWTYGNHYALSPGYVGQSPYPPGVGWPMFRSLWIVNPFTTLVWTMAELQALQAGFHNSGGGGGETDFDQLYVLVTYSKVPPVVATQAASGVTPSQATLNGQLTDDGGEPCTLFFEWGPSLGLGNTVAAGTGSTGASFSALLLGLLAGTNYYFRAGATNSRGTSYGAILSLTSIPGGGDAATVLTLAAVEVTENGGKLQGLVQDSIGRYGDVRFEWGGTTAYGNTTPWQSGFKTGDMFNAQLLSLAEGAVYHFRAQFRGSGIVSGSDAAFSTLSNPGAITLVDEETLEGLL